MRTVNKKEIVTRVSERCGVPKPLAREIVQFFLDAIIDELADGNRLELRGFAVFETKWRPARRALNPRTLGPVYVPGRRVVRVKPSSMIPVNGPTVP